MSDAQAGALTIAFRYADDRGLLLVNLADLKTLLMYIASDEGKKELSMEYGVIAPGTLQVLMRKILELEAQGGEALFGERSLDVQDFCISNNHDFAPINILRLMHAVRSPLVFSTFILSLLTEVYNTFPEVGDLPRPRLVFIVDEAHILFQDAPKAFLAEITMMMKLIRSKGVSVLFCTQNPADIPDDILGQL